MQLSEEELIAAIRKLAGVGPGVLVGIGDDAAVLEAGGGSLVLTTDMLLENVHFRRGSISARDLGYKAVVVNVSDIAAMAASPRYAVVALGLPPEVAEGWVVELYGGINEACREYAVALAGGDLSRSGEIVVSVALAGEVAPGRAVLRSGARVGDRIVVTGRLGAAAGGLKLEEEGDPRDIASPWGRELLAAQHRPVARVGEAATLASAGASAMMDISDGLAKDLRRLCVESGVGARIDLDSVPVSPLLEHLCSGGDGLELALSGGEDYELLATVAPDGVAVARAELKERFGVKLSDIGEVIEEGLIAIGPDGERDLEAKGWDHFG